MKTRKLLWRHAGTAAHRPLHWHVGGIYTDILKTCDKMKAAGVDVRLHVKEKMGHVYPLWPCPEGKEAREEIADIIRNS